MDSPPAKRLKLTGYDPYDERDTSDYEDEGDELELEPEEVSEMRHPDYVLEKKRARAMTRYEQAMAGIIAKYSRNFEDVGDELDLDTGAIVVDRGHLRNMRYDTDLGVEDESDGGECEDEGEDEGVLLSEMPDSWDGMAAVANKREKERESARGPQQAEEVQDRSVGSQIPGVAVHPAAIAQTDGVFLSGYESASSTSQERPSARCTQKPKPRKNRSGNPVRDYKRTSIWTPEAGDEDEWVPHSRSRTGTMGAFRRAMAMPNVCADDWISATDKNAGSGSPSNEEASNLQADSGRLHAEGPLSSKPYESNVETSATVHQRNSQRDSFSKFRKNTDNGAHNSIRPRHDPGINENVVKDGPLYPLENEGDGNSAAVRRSRRKRRQVEFLGKTAWPKRKERRSRRPDDVIRTSDDLARDSAVGRRDADAVLLNASGDAANLENSKEHQDCNATAVHSNFVGSSCFVIAIPAPVPCDDYQYIEDVPDEPTLLTPPESSHDTSDVDMGNKHVSAEEITIPDSQSEPRSSSDQGTLQLHTDQVAASCLLAVGHESPILATQTWRCHPDSDTAESTRTGVAAANLTPRIATTLPLVSEPTIDGVAIPTYMDTTTGLTCKHTVDVTQAERTQTTPESEPTEAGTLESEVEVRAPADRETEIADIEGSSERGQTNMAALAEEADTAFYGMAHASKASVTQATESVSMMAMAPEDHDVADNELADQKRPDPVMENGNKSAHSADKAPSGEPSDITPKIEDLPVRRKRGRPRKDQSLFPNVSKHAHHHTASLPNKPNNEPVVPAPSEQTPKRKRGRPRKSLDPSEEGLPQALSLETAVDLLPPIEPDTEQLHGIETKWDGTLGAPEPMAGDVPLAAADPQLTTESGSLPVAEEATLGAQNTILEDQTSPSSGAEVTYQADVDIASETQSDPSLPQQLQSNENVLWQTIQDSDDPLPFSTDSFDDPATAQPQLPRLEMSPRPEQTMTFSTQATHLGPSGEAEVMSSSPSRKLQRLSLAKPSTPLHPALKKMKGAPSSRRSLVSLLSTDDVEEDELLRSDDPSPLVRHSSTLGGRSSITPIRRNWKSSILTTEVYRTPVKRRSKRDSVSSSIAQDLGNGPRTCGANGYRCEADFCFTCL